MKIFIPLFDNEEAFQQLKQLMVQRRNLSIKLDNEPKAWISTGNIAEFRYKLNQKSWQWILNYLNDGNPEDFGVFPSQIEPLQNFQAEALKNLIGSKCRVLRIPFIRETRPYITLIGIFKYGRIYFKIKRTNEFVDYLFDNKIC